MILSFRIPKSLMFSFDHVYFLKIQFFFFFFWLCWVFVAVKGLSLVVVSRGYSLVAMLGFLIVVASLVVERGLWSVGFSNCGTQA